MAAGADVAQGRPTMRCREGGEDPDRIEEDMGDVLGGGPAGDSSYGYDDNLYEG